MKPYDVDESGCAAPVPLPVAIEEKQDGGEIVKLDEVDEKEGASDEDLSKKEIPNDWEKVENEGEEKNTQESVS